jgi:CO/xanthine dehydrogenase Mo-binding subunit
MISGGGAVEENFDQYPLLRMSEAPAIEIHFVVFRVRIRRTN